jgi:hypothetical protein
LVEIRETVQEVVVPSYVETEAPKRATAASLPLAHVSEEELLGYGVPAEWISDVRSATEETLLTVADHLPAEAAEAVLELATGGKPRPPLARLADGPTRRHRTNACLIEPQAEWGCRQRYLRRGK